MSEEESNREMRTMKIMKFLSFTNGEPGLF